MLVKEDPIYLRASLSANCNLDCIYCPTEIGMENQVPNFLKGQKLSVEQYCNNLLKFANKGIKAITFTGGEPTLNNEIVNIVSFARKIFERVEITTNGFMLNQYINQLAPFFDVVKISLDAIDKDVFERITQRKYNQLTTTLNSIESCCKLGLKVAVNVVVLKENINQIEKIINLCSDLNKKYYDNIYVSLLDFYFSPAKRAIWENNFIPLDKLKSKFVSLYGEPTKQERFGCQFYWFNANSVLVRFKDSSSATQRASKCENCTQYCQEGIFSIKHSVEGWITTCLSNDVEFGEYLSAKINSQESDNILAKVLNDVKNTKTMSNSFNKMIDYHKLTPRNIKEEF